MLAPLYQAKAEFLRMLGHPVLIRVLELLQGGPKPVRDLLAEIDIEPSSLSQKLAIPRRSDIVTATPTAPPSSTHSLTAMSPS
jgi:ArsR family transcriptional regulator